MARPAVTRFLVGVVSPAWSGTELAALSSALDTASRRLRDSGVAVRFLQTIPGGHDTTGAACLFEAESPAAVRRVLAICQVPASGIEVAPGGRRARQTSSVVLGSVRHGSKGGGAPAP